MDFTALQARFAERYIGNELTSTVIKNHLNVAYKNFLAETEFPVEEAVTTINFAVGDESKSLPANVFGVLSVRDATNNSKLDPLYGWGQSVLQFPDHSSSARGGPTFYRVVGNNLYLLPIPSAAITVEIVYSQEPADLSNGGDTPLLPVRYHDAIVNMALAMALMDDERPEAAQGYAQAYQSFVTQAVAELRNARTERYPVPQDTFYEDF